MEAATDEALSAAEERYDPTSHEPDEEDTPRGAVSAEPQTALDETVIEDAALEKALEDRQIAKGKAGEARKKFNTLTDVVKGQIEALELGDGDAIRVGRFRVAKRAVAAKSVAFDVEPSSRLTFKVVDED